MEQRRPVNLDLMSLKFPPMAVASILHRLSGLVLFLLLPFMLYFLQRSLVSYESYAQLQECFATLNSRLVLWAFGAALGYHMLAGIRHLFLDMHVGESLRAGRRSAVFVIIVAVILAIYLGIYLW